MANQYGITDAYINGLINSTSTKSTNPSAWGNATVAVKTNVINTIISSCEQNDYTAGQTKEVLSIVHARSL